MRTAPSPRRPFRSGGPGHRGRPGHPGGPRRPGGPGRPRRPAGRPAGRPGGTGGYGGTGRTASPALRAAVAAQAGTAELRHRAPGVLARRLAAHRDDGERGAQAAEYAMLGGVSAAACGTLVLILRKEDSLAPVISFVVQALRKAIGLWFG